VRSERCLSCGHLNKQGVFCGRCGKRLPDSAVLSSGKGCPAGGQHTGDQMPVPEQLKMTRETLARDPDNVEARCKLGEFYFRLGKLALAEKEFKIVKAVEPANIVAREHLAKICQQDGNEAGAVKELESIEMLPECPASSLVFLADLQIVLRDRKKALRALKRAVEREPGNIKIRLQYEKLLNEEA